jgi:hypothetical protein
MSFNPAHKSKSFSILEQHAVIAAATSTFAKPHRHRSRIVAEAAFLDMVMSRPAGLEEALAYLVELDAGVRLMGKRGAPNVLRKNVLAALAEADKFGHLSFLTAEAALRDGATPEQHAMLDTRRAMIPASVIAEHPTRPYGDHLKALRPQATLPKAENRRTRLENVFAVQLAKIEKLRQRRTPRAAPKKREAQDAEKAAAMKRHKEAQRQRDLAAGIATFKSAMS